VTEAYEDSAAIVAWSATKLFCACCWIDHATAERTQLVGLAAHHVIKRSRIRCDRPWNLLRLCERCHRLAEGECIRVNGEPLPTLTEGHCLWLKLETDRDEWQPKRLERLKAPTRLADLLPVPRVFLRERAIYRPTIDWRDLGSVNE
jgi:hypothetical protein